VDRIEALQSELVRNGLAGALATSPENVRYLTSYYTEAFNPFTVAVVPAAGQLTLIVLRQDETLARALSRVPVVVHDLRPDGFWETARICQTALAKVGVSSGVIGLEFGSVTVDRLRILEESFPEITFRDAASLMTTLRMIKDPEEQLALRRAASLAVSGVRAVEGRLRPGISEAEVKTIICQAAYLEAARLWPEAVIQTSINVLTGSKVGRLHDLATGRLMSAGEPVFVLAGVAWSGYWGGDAARTFFVPSGQVPAGARHALDATLQAQRAAIAQLRPGSNLAAASQAAEAVLTENKLRERRLYRMFRGLGLTNSERPTALELDLPLSSGMSLSVQIYIQLDQLIVGQTDSVLITDTGAEILTDTLRSA
jgi:Xaa-Pro dipeptidase